MGIKDLNKLIKKYAEDAVSLISNYEELKDKKLAVDAFEILYKFKSVSEDNFLVLLYDFSDKLRKYDIKVTFVIDGKPIKEKHAAREEREKRFISATTRLEIKEKENENLLKEQNIIEKEQRIIEREQTNNIIEKEQILIIDDKIRENIKVISSIKRQLIRVNNDDITKSCEMWKLMGFDIGKSEHEGEAGCAKLAKNGIVDYAVSNDTDTMCFQDDINILRNITMSGGQPIQCINSKTVREKFGMEREQFIELCILCGCDFSKKLIRLAAMGAFVAIKQYGTIDNIVKLNKYQIPSYGWTPEDAKHVFMTKNCDVEIDAGNRDVEKLNVFLSENNISRFAS